MATGCADPPGARGYATEGSRALIRKGFTKLGVQGVVADTMTVNAASRRVMEKARLRYVRTSFNQKWQGRIEGCEHGDVEYALRKADWERRQGKWRDAGGYEWVSRTRNRSLPLLEPLGPSRPAVYQRANFREPPKNEPLGIPVRRSSRPCRSPVRERELGGKPDQERP